MYSHLLSVCGVHSCCVQTMDATSSVAVNALCTAMEVQSKEIVGDLNRKLSITTKYERQYQDGMVQKSLEKLIVTKQAFTSRKNFRSLEKFNCSP